MDQCEFLHQFDLSKMPECYFFSKFGECTNPECLYRHLAADDKSGECPWYNRGFCKHGPDRSALTCTRPPLPLLYSNFVISFLLFIVLQVSHLTQASGADSVTSRRSCVKTTTWGFVLTVPPASLATLNGTPPFPNQMTQVHLGSFG